MPEHILAYYFNYDYIPLTLKTIVLGLGVDVDSVSTMDRLEDIIIFVEAQKADVHWNQDYAGWNNNNKVYYGGEWLKANFYDRENLLSSHYLTTSQVIRQPYVSDYTSNHLTYQFVGWDLNNDTVVDVVPATSMVNINAHAVYEAHTISDWIIVNDATCTENGTKQKYVWIATKSLMRKPSLLVVMFKGSLWKGLLQLVHMKATMSIVARFVTNSSILISPTN